jgi:pimeloyl-ACP methyl ester carboxylesterase
MFGRVLALIVLLLVILVIAGSVYERYAEARDRARYPPLGRLVEVEQHQMHLYCTGIGAPTVILEAPANSSALDWGLVQPEIAKFARVCSYDRAGFGWSETGPAPRTAQQAVQELHILLQDAEERGPYLLVGASYGGHIVRLFAHDYPTETAGLVLVDPRPEQLFSIPALRQEGQNGLAMAPVLNFLGDIGLLRPFIAWAPEKLSPASVVPVYKAHPGSYEIVFQAKFVHTMNAEAQAIDTSDKQVEAIHSLGDLPLIVIRHGKPMFGSMPPAEASEIEQQWQAFQEEITRQSTQGRLVVAVNSGHLIQLEQPTLIVEAVQRLFKHS